MSKLEDQNDVRGWDSLMLLCLSRVNPNSAVDLIIEKYPKILSAFAAEMFGSDHFLVSRLYIKFGLVDVKVKKDTILKVIIGEAIKNLFHHMF